MSAATPFFLSAVFLTPSIVRLFKFFHEIPRLLRAVVTSENIFSAFVVLFRLRREHNSSVILNLTSIPRIKINSWAVSVVSLLSSIAREKYLKNFALSFSGHVLRRDGDSVLRVALNLEVTGKRKRGRPKKTWKKQVEEETEKVGLKKEDALRRDKWRDGVREIAEGMG